MTWDVMLGAMKGNPMSNDWLETDASTDPLVGF